MSSFLILDRDQQQVETTKKLHDNLGASLRYASGAQGIQPTSITVSNLLQADKECITRILAASGIVPADGSVKLSAILFHSEPPPPPQPPAPKHTLLSLPPEMRNRIYRFALVEPEDLIVYSDWRTRREQPPPKEPPLLSVCRQIRDEALDIYYQENNFKITIKDYDAAFYTSSCRTSRLFRESNHHFDIIGSVNWWKLHSWLYSYYINECGTFVASKPPSDIDVGAQFFRIVEDMRDGCDWDQTERVMDSTRKALAVHNYLWRDGEDDDDDDDDY